MRAVLAAAFLMLVPAAAGDPVYGTWTLDPARSQPQPGAAADLCYVTTLDALGNGKFRVNSTRVHGNGTTARQDAIFAFDGGDHPNGLGEGLTTAFSRIDDHRYVMVMKDHNKPLATVIRTISDDGNTMTSAATGTINGTALRETLVFARKDSVCEPPKPEDKKP